MIAIPHLDDYRRRTIERKPATAAEWVADNTLLSGLGLGLQETAAYLNATQPSLEQFAQWIRERHSSIDEQWIARINAALAGEWNPPALDPVLTSHEMRHWDEHGFVILHDAVTPESAASAASAIYEFIGADPEQPDTWYGDRPYWVPLFHHPAIDANRRSPRIHAAFAQLWGRSDMWMNVDQCGFNPPERAGHQFRGSGVHWDVSLALPIPFGTQGILYLTDTPAEQGAFRCVPGFHRRIESWLASTPDPRSANLASETVPVAGSAGDLVIWHHALPHGASPNRGTRPRVVQYMDMRPSRWEYNPEWK